MGSLQGSEQEMYEAVFAARESALAALTPAAAGSAVDEAARSTLEQRGFGPNFKHSTGHGVGFQCINPDARPRLHPKSEDRLAPGMVFNVEPAIYIEQVGGIRHCDMVFLADDGCELLTPFHTTLESLVLLDR